MTTYLRPAQPTDAGRTGEILWENAQADPSVADLFSCAEAIAFGGRMIDRGWVTVAIVDQRVEAFLARDSQDIEALYVSRDANRKGLGKLLLTDAMECAETLRLHVHQTNIRAHRFYKRLGFQERATAEACAANSSTEMFWQRGQTA